jgi:Holliday junction resolvase RusA-like endonuclease
MYHRKVFIDYLPPMNTAHTRAHWGVAHREVKKWRRLVFVTFPKKHKPDIPLQKCNIIITRMSSRQPDYDNMVMAAKPIYDALKKNEIIQDDAPQNVKREYLWKKELKLSGVLIEIIGM